MSKSEKSDRWAVRVDGEEDFLRECCKKFSEREEVETFLATFHVGKSKENTHCHFCVKNNKIIQKQTFALKVKEVFNVASKSDYSVKIWDGSDKALSYLFHEVPHNILANKGYSDEDIDKFIAMDAQIQVVVQKNKEKAGTKLVDKAIEHFSGQVPEKYEVFYHMMQLIKSGENYHPGTFMLKRFVEEVIIKLTPAGREFDNLVYAEFKSLFRE